MYCKINHIAKLLLSHLLDNVGVHSCSLWLHDGDRRLRMSCRRYLLSCKRSTSKPRLSMQRLVQMQ